MTEAAASLKSAENHKEKASSVYWGVSKTEEGKDRAMWITIALTGVLLSFMTLRFLKQLWSQKHYPPGPLRLPVIGNIWKLLINFSQDSFIKLAKQYGNVYTLWVGNFPVVVFSGFEAVKGAAIDHSQCFVDRPLIPFIEAIGNGKGIVFSNGHTWKKQRKFGLVTMRKLGLGKKGTEHQIEEEAHQLVQTLTAAKGRTLDPVLPITDSVTSVICALAFGRQFSVEDEEFFKLRDALLSLVQFGATLFHLLYELFPWIMEHLPGPHKKAIAASDFLASFAMKEIQKHKEHGSLHEPQDFIDYYLLQMEKSKRDPTLTYNEENLTQCIVELFIGGTETVASTLCWGLLLMANYPDIQEKTQEEIDSVFGSSPSFSYHDRKKVPYTNAVIHEIQRYKYVFLFGSPRQCSKDVNLFDFFIPKGTAVIPDLRSVLLDPTKWETPQEFNPNHFLDKDGHFVASKAFLPFGAGARVCLGEQLARTELFIFFTTLLRTFTFRPPEGVKKIRDEAVIHFSINPSPSQFCVVPRKSGP